MATIQTAVAGEVIKHLLLNVNNIISSVWIYDKNNIDNETYNDDMFSQKLTLIESQIKDTEAIIKSRPDDTKTTIIYQIKVIKNIIENIKLEIQAILKIMREHPQKYFYSFRQYDINKNQEKLKVLKKDLNSQFDLFCKILMIDIYKNKM